MRTDELNNKHLIAAEGKVLRRIADGWNAGSEIYLGYTYYLNGELLEEPLLELPEHYEEIIPLDDMRDEDFDMVAEPDIAALMSFGSIPEETIPETVGRPTLADLLGRALVEIEGLKREVSELRKGAT